MEEKVLYNVLSDISRNGNGTNQAPDYNYIKSLESIGLIKLDYDRTYITNLGASVLNLLRQQFEKW